MNLNERESYMPISFYINERWSSRVEGLNGQSEFLLRKVERKIPRSATEYDVQRCWWMMILRPSTTIEAFTSLKFCSLSMLGLWLFIFRTQKTESTDLPTVFWECDTHKSQVSTLKSAVCKIRRGRRKPIETERKEKKKKEKKETKKRAKRKNGF